MLKTSNQAVEERILELSNGEDDCAYEKLLSRPYDAAQPLLIIIHPGDMTEVDPDRELARYSADAQNKLADTINNWKGEVAILHRYSCYEFIEESSRTEIDLCESLQSARDHAILICYGDNLDQFAKDIEDATLHRPEIIITGAYHDPENGCVDYVAGLLNKVCPRVKIDPSAYVAP